MTKLKSFPDKKSHYISVQNNHSNYKMYIGIDTFSIVLQLNIFGASYLKENYTA